MQDLRSKTDLLTTDHLTMIVKVVAAQKVELTETFLRHGLATEVLRFFFGNAWTNEHVFPQHKTVEKPHRSGRKFLKTEYTQETEGYLHLDRVGQLAECAFNLQQLEGVRERLARMQRDDLESALGELECAAMMAAPELRFKFVTPTGRKGSDYEAEVITPAGRTVCCEIKTKSELTDLTDRSLAPTIEKARQQLPKELPGLVLIKIPLHWRYATDLQSIVHNSVNEAFRKSQRLVAIGIRWEERVAVRDGHFFVKKFNFLMNEKSSLFGADISALIDRFGRLQNPNWIDFGQFVDSSITKWGIVVAG